jgi:hypothetical protein
MIHRSRFFAPQAPPDPPFLARKPLAWPCKSRRLAAFAGAPWPCRTALRVNHQWECRVKMFMINLMSYTLEKVSHIPVRYTEPYMWYSLLTQRATPVGPSPPEWKPPCTRILSQFNNGSVMHKATHSFSSFTSGMS